MRRALAPFSKLKSSNHTQSSADFITNTSGFSFRYTHQLGLLWHRQLRKMRRLHGPLRLRGDRGGRCVQPSHARSRRRLAGIRTKGPMAPDIPLHLQRPAEYVFSRHVEQNSRKSVKPRVPAMSFRLRNSARKAACASWRSAATAGSGVGPAKSIPRSHHTQVSHRISAPPGQRAAAACAPGPPRREMLQRGDCGRRRPVRQCGIPYRRHAPPFSYAGRAFLLGQPTANRSQRCR